MKKMINITSEKLQEILEKHEKWLKSEDDGERADLESANLRDANLIDVNLESANLEGANLRDANLIDADLRCANLIDADLRCADLKWCNTQGLRGQRVICVQVDTTRENNLISYWIDLDIVNTGCFQGSMQELEKKVQSTHKDNEFIRKRYERAIAYIKNEVEEDKNNDRS